MIRRTGTWLVGAVAASALILTGCAPEPEPAPTATASVQAESSPSSLIPDDVIDQLDAAVAAEAEPIATTSTQTEGLPEGATVEVLQLDRTESGGYLLRLRLSWDEETSLSAKEHRSLSLDGGDVFVDGIRLVDDASERFVLPTVYEPLESERIDSAERYRCLCSDLVSRVPAEGQILSALYGPLAGDAAPSSLTVQVPGFESIERVPVG